MRPASFSIDGVASWGLALPDGVIDARTRLRGLLRYARPYWWVGSGALDVGREHRAEARRERSGYPTVFARFPGSQVGHGRPMRRPPESPMFDYEGELAVVIGKTCRRVPQDVAMSVIAGFACYNDGSIRDFQRHTSEFHPGKNWPATGAFGPWLVTSDEISDPTELAVQTRLNGQVVQSAGLHQLIFTLPELIAYCSICTELHPGDVIVTGTPAGVGSASTRPLWMRDGDLV